MRVAEIFRSIQGEGRLTGAESIFVRTSGCNLRCRWCDTPYASWTPEGEDLSVEEIAGRVEELATATPEEGTAQTPSARPTVAALWSDGERSEGPVSHVVLTGGEPMLFAELIPLTAGLRRTKMHVTIETAGTLYLPVACDLMSISPKLSNSTPPADRDARWTWRHETNRRAPEVVRRLISEHDYQLKFVVGNLEDCTEVERYLADFPEIDRSRAMLMPQGTKQQELAARAEWLEPYCAEHDLAYCPRRQIQWFGSARGT